MKRATRIIGLDDGEFYQIFAQEFDADTGKELYKIPLNKKQLQETLFDVTKRELEGQLEFWKIFSQYFDTRITYKGNPILSDNL